MSQEGSIVPVTRRRGYSSYRGETTPAPRQPSEPRLSCPRAEHGMAHRSHRVADPRRHRLPVPP